LDTIIEKPAYDELCDEFMAQGPVLNATVIQREIGLSPIRPGMHLSFGRIWFKHSEYCVPLGFIIMCFRYNPLLSNLTLATNTGSLRQKDEVPKHFIIAAITLS